MRTELQCGRWKAEAGDSPPESPLLPISMMLPESRDMPTPAFTSTGPPPKLQSQNPGRRRLPSHRPSRYGMGCADVGISSGRNPRRFLHFICVRMGSGWSRVPYMPDCTPAAPSACPESGWSRDAPDAPGRGWMASPDIQAHCCPE